MSQELLLVMDDESDSDFEPDFAMTGPPVHIIIDPDGDVQLNVGLEPLYPCSLQVSSKMLSIASNVFKVLFQPRFAEGTELARAGKVEIPLPDDDFDSLVKLCGILHHRGEEFAPVQTVTESSLLQLAILVDKYNCYESVDLWAKYCFVKNPFIKKQFKDGYIHVEDTVTALSDWTYILKVFRRERDMMILVRRLLLQATESSSTDESFSRLPPALYDKIINRRQCIVTETLQEIKARLEEERSETSISEGHEALFAVVPKTAYPSSAGQEIARIFLYGTMLLATEAELGCRISDLKWPGSIDGLRNRLRGVQASLERLLNRVELKLATNIETRSIYRLGSDIYENILNHLSKAILKDL